MERLTFDGRFCDIAQCTETPGGSFCEGGCCSQRKVWDRLKQYEDTGYTPEEIAKLQDPLIAKNAALLKAREELKDLYNSISQLDDANSSLMAANEKLAADRKALINERVNTAGSTNKHTRVPVMGANGGICDGCCEVCKGISAYVHKG